MPERTAVPSTDTTCATGAHAHRSRPSTLRLVWPELLLGLCLGTAFLMVTPLWEAPDEPYHFANIVYVRKWGLYTMSHAASELPHELRGESSQPPLYYLIASAASRVLGRPDEVEFAPIEEADCWGEAWRFCNFGDESFPRGLRALGLAFLLVGAVLLARACRLAYPGDTHLPGTAVAMLWAVPQVLFIGTTISNDSLALAMGGLIFMLWVQQWRAPSWWRIAVLGIVAPCALGVKLNLAPLVVAGAILSAAVGKGRVGARLLRVLIYVGPGLLILAAAFLAVPDALSRVSHVVGARLGVRAVRLRPMIMLPLVWESFWGRFGWMNVTVHEGVRLAYWSFTVALVMGVGFTLRRVRDVRAAALIAVLLVVIAIVALVGDLTHSGQGQGRHLFPAVAAMSFLGALGIRGYLSAAGSRAVAWLATIGGALYVLMVVMPDAYGEEPSSLALGVSCCQGSHATPSLTVRQRERQAFVSARNYLCRVGVVPGTHGLPVRGHIRLSLTDRASGRLMAERIVSGREIRDGRFLFLDFPPIRSTRQRQFVITVEALEDLRGQVMLFLSPEDVCPDANRLTGQGDLRFATYHLP